MLLQFITGIAVKSVEERNEENCWTEQFTFPSKSFRFFSSSKSLDKEDLDWVEFANNLPLGRLRNWSGEVKPQKIFFLGNQKKILQF